MAIPAETTSTEPTHSLRGAIAPDVGGALRTALYGAAVAIGGGMWALSELCVAGKGMLDALDRR